MKLLYSGQSTFDMEAYVNISGWLC